MIAYQGWLRHSVASTISEIEMVADDGKCRKMICLPLRKLAGWLQTPCTRGRRNFAPADFIDKNELA